MTKYIFLWNAMSLSIEKRYALRSVLGWSLTNTSTLLITEIKTILAARQFYQCCPIGDTVRPELKKLLEGDRIALALNQSDQGNQL